MIILPGIMVVGARMQCTNVSALLDETGNDYSDITWGIDNRLDHVFAWPHSLSDKSAGNQVRDFPRTSNEISADIRCEGNVVIRVIT